MLLSIIKSIKRPNNILLNELYFLSDGRTPYFREADQTYRKHDQVDGCGNELRRGKLIKQN